MARTVLIVYEHFTPSVAHIGRGFWSGIFEDTKEGYDYGSVGYLIKQCVKDGLDYKVLRSHRNGGRSVILSSVGHLEKNKQTQ